MVLWAEEPPLDFRKPQVLIFAGPNGAGKSTFAQEFLPAEAQCLRFLNADLIAQGLSPFAPEEVAIQAGLRNFETLYKPLVDWWMLFDGSTPLPTLQEEGSR